MNSTEYDWKCDRTLIEVEVQDAGKVPTVVVHSGGAGHNVHKAEATHEDTTLHTAFVDDEPLFRPIKPEPECVDDTDAVPPQFISTEVVSRDDGLSSTIEATHELEVCSTAHDGKRSTIFDNGENVPCASSVPARFKRQTKTKSVSCRSTAITAKRTRLEKEFEIAEPVLGDEVISRPSHTATFSLLQGDVVPPTSSSSSGDQSTFALCSGQAGITNGKNVMGINVKKKNQECFILISTTNIPMHSILNYAPKRICYGGLPTNRSRVVGRKTASKTTNNSARRAVHNTIVINSRKWSL